MVLEKKDKIYKLGRCQKFDKMVIFNLIYLESYKFDENILGLLILGGIARTIADVRSAQYLK